MNSTRFLLEVLKYYEKGIHENTLSLDFKPETHE